MDERALVSRCLAGDNDAWREFIDQYSGYLYRVVRSRLLRFSRRVPDDSVVEEILSDIVFDLINNDFRALKSFQGKSSLHTWLAMIANRKVGAYYKNLSRQNSADDWMRDLFNHVQREFSPEPDVKLIQDEDQALLTYSLQKLPSRDRSMIMLHFEAGYTYEQVGRVFELSPSAVHKSISRVVKDLGKIMKNRQ